MVVLNSNESKKALKRFFKKTLDKSASRLEDAGDIPVPMVRSLPLSCYYEAVLCYTLGCFSACIGVVSMATEFHLRGLMSSAIMDSVTIGRTNIINPVRYEQERKRLRSLDTTYGKLIGKVERDPKMYGALVPTLDDHKAMVAIRNAHIHHNLRKLRETYHVESASELEDVPPEYRGMIMGTITALRSGRPKDQALAAVWTAGKILGTKKEDIPFKIGARRFNDELEFFVSDGLVPGF
jgi:hypothetical protein